MKSFEVCENIDDLDFRLNQLSYDDSLAVFVSLQYVLNTNLLKGKNIYCFKDFEVINNYNLKILMKMNFTFVDELNNFIGRAVETGLIKKWLKNEETIYKYTRVDDNYILTTQIMYSGFILCFSVVVFAILVAIAEKVVYAKAKQPNAKKAWIIAEKTFNPYRYFLHNNIRW